MTTASAEVTLAALDPRDADERHYNRTKTSPRYHGSFFLRMRRPSRTPAFSRRYVAGDPIRLIDWRAFARTDQLIIREQREEASARVAIVLDARDSMQWPDAETRPHLPAAVPTKLEIACRIGAYLSFTHGKSGDDVRLFILTDEGLRTIAVASSSAVLSLFTYWEHEGFSLASVLAQSEDRPATYNPDVGYLISDVLSGPPPKIFEQVRVSWILHLLSSLEVETAWLHDEHSYFESQPVAKEYLGSALTTGGAYNQRLGAWRREVEATAEQSSDRYLFLTDQTPIRSFQEAIGAME